MGTITATASSSSQIADYTSSWSGGYARQGTYGDTNHYGVMIFPFTPSDLADKTITNIRLSFTCGGSGSSSSKTLYMKRATKNSVSGTGSAMMGSAIGTVSGRFYNNTIAFNFNSTTNAIGFENMVDHFQNNLMKGIGIYKSESSGSSGYSANYLQIDSATITITYDDTPKMSTGSLSDATLDFGATNTMTIMPQNAEYSHTVEWRVGSYRFDQTVAAGETSASYTIPLEWINAVPGDTSIAASAALHTYKDGTEVGKVEYPFTLTVPSTVVPTIESLVVTRIDGNVPVSWEVYLQGLSKAQVAIASPAGAYGSSITGYAISGGGSSSTLSTLTTGLLSDGEIIFSGTVTDTRQRTTTKSSSISVRRYAAPAFNSVKAFRCDSAGAVQNDGTYISVQASFSYDSVDGKNSAACKVQYKESSSSTLSPETILSNNEAIVIGNDLISAAKQYDVVFTLTDGIYGSGDVQPIVKTVTVGSKTYTMNLKRGGKGVAFGQVSSRDNAVEIASGWGLYTGPITAGQISANGITASGALTNNVSTRILEGGSTDEQQIYFSNASASLVSAYISKGSATSSAVVGLYDGTNGWPVWLYDEDKNFYIKRPLVLSSALSPSCGGTGQASLQATRNAMGLGNTTGALPIANGGTGETTATAALAALGAAATSHGHAVANISDIQFGSNFIRLGTFAICWGQNSVNIQSIVSKGFKTGSVIGFPITFESAPKVLLTSKHNGDYTGVFGYEANTVGTTSFKITASNPTASTSGSSIDNASVQWVAFGFTV